MSAPHGRTRSLWPWPQCRLYSPNPTITTAASRMAAMFKKRPFLLGENAFLLYKLIVSPEHEIVRNSISRKLFEKY